MSEQYSFETDGPLLVLHLRKPITPDIACRLLKIISSENGEMRFCSIEGVEAYSIVTPYRIIFQLAHLFVNDIDKKHIKTEVINMMNLSEIDINWMQASLETDYCNQVLDKKKLDAIRK